jgi:PAS domain S-box-containing protein
VKAEERPHGGSHQQDIAEHAPVMLWITDRDGYCTYLNRRWYNFTGQSEAEGEGTGWLRATHPDDRRRTEAAFRTAIEKRQPFEAEYRLRRADGEYRWVLDAAAPRFASDGAFTGFVGSVIDIHERREAEAALREREVRLRLAVAAGELGEWELDVATDRSERAFRHDQVFGYDEPLPKWGFGNFIDHVVPEDREEVEARFRHAVETGSGWHFECRITRRNDGEMRWIQGRGEPLAGPDGRAEKIFGLVSDITDRKCAEHALRESEDRLRFAIDATELGTWQFDLTDGSLTWDARTLELFDFQPGSAISYQEFLSRVHPEERSEVEQRLQRALDAEGPGDFTMEYRIVSPPGSARVKRWVTARGRTVFNEDARAVRLIGTVQDVTGRARAEEELRHLYRNLENRVGEAIAERKLWADIFYNTDALIAAIDPAFRLLGVNKAYADTFEQVFGVYPASGDNLLALLARQPDQQAAMQEVWDRALAGERALATKEWNSRIYELRCTPLLDVNDRVIGAFQYAQDVTDRLRSESRLKDAEDALRQAQKMEAIGQLTGGVAHDFNNLLTIIRSSADFLRRRDLPEERRRRYVDAISDTVDRAARVTGQLLAFARRQALKPEVFEVPERVNVISEMLRTLVGSRIAIEIESVCERCFAEADVAQFETALVNMTVNARDAMPEGGTITVRIDSIAEMAGGADGARDFISVSIADRGTGIPQDRLTQIFEPFFTTKSVGKGTGLGLSQVYGFAKQSGGDVRVESTVGEGSVFTLLLPRVGVAPRPAPIRKDREGPADSGRGRRVLVVEDNADVGAFSTQILQDLGYETTWALDGEDALRLLAENPGGFDVVFSDVVMPGISGIALGHEVRRRYPDLPIVLTSGYSHVLAEEGRHGFELLQKPYAAEELSRVLRRVVGASA